MKVFPNIPFLWIGIIIIIAQGIVGIIGNDIYSGADEAAHFDYINYLIKNKSLPTLDVMIDSRELEFNESNPKTIPHHLQHEAVQPPLYYFMASFVGGLFSDAYTRLIILRSLAVILLTVSFYICYRTYEILVREDAIEQSHVLFFSVSMLFISSPYFQRIMIPLNNEHLLVLMVSALIYLLVKYYYLSKLTTYQLVLLSVITGSAVLTKFTSIYLIVVVAGFLLIKKMYRAILFYGAMVIIVLSPWLAFNYKNYHSFTGAKQHIAIVAPMVNPTNHAFNLFDIIKSLPNFLTTIWFWQGIYPVERIVSDFLSVLVVLSLLTALFFTRKEKFQYIFISSVIGNILILAVVTLTTPIFSIIGRYMYMNYIPFTIMFYLFTMRVIQKKI